MKRQLWLALFGLCVVTECAHTWSGRGLVSEIRQHNGQPALFVNGTASPKPTR